MRILMLGWEFPPHLSGGLGTACAGITRALAEGGADVLLVLPRAHGDEDRSHAHIVGCDQVPEAALSAGEPESLLRVLAVRSGLVPYADRSSRGARIGGGSAPATPYGADLPTEVARYARAVGTIAGRERFDLIHAHDWMSFPAGLAARATSGRPLVAHVHSTEKDRSGGEGDPAVREIERLGMEGADRVVCVSRYTAELVRSQYGIAPAKVRVVHNGVAPPTHGVRRRAARSRPVVLFLGRVTVQKGPDVFLEAAARVKTVRPGVRFVVAGSGDLLPETIERAAELGLAESVRFTGFLSGADVERVYARADCYVMPSISEPFGISPLEAMSADVPVVVSRQSGAAEVLASGLKFDSWDVEGLADKILALLERPALRQDLVEDGRGDVGRLRWDRNARLLSGVYRELVS